MDAVPLGTLVSVIQTLLPSLPMSMTNHSPTLVPYFGGQSPVLGPTSKLVGDYRYYS